ncbi:hypothetical protein GCM10009830_23130 [Glycomyces endophyticus]|uniref:VCBS repeat-containing protein n=1 Tax=Glycomyces endophyticus TaxID=480996 RepID=A0ABN2GSJ4_9ACTN
MNDASRQKRPRRAIGRAAAAAVVLGATLLAYPVGTASAQEEFDCDAIRDDRRSPSMARAFEAAAYCGFEIRVSTRSDPYSMLYATPEGQYHLEATAAPTGWNGDESDVDPSLMAFDGGLTQRTSAWSFWLQNIDKTQPLFFSWGGVLDWNGADPTPTYADTTAVYDELAPGLDLRVEMDIGTAELRFTADDAEAWQDLSSGLRLQDADDAVLENGSLRMPIESVREIGAVETTPFTGLDANGAFTPVGLELGDDDALALTLPAGALETTAFPLTVTTQWAYRGPGIGEWGAVSSAAPDLAAYRGIGAGTDASFLEHPDRSGDAGVGPYCDGFAADCTDTSESASYWNFFTEHIDEIHRYDETHEWHQSVDRATFSIDLAPDENGEFTCRTPDLVPVDGYRPDVTWNNRPEPVGAPTAAQCEDEVVEYDVTDAVTTALADGADVTEIAFGMTESTEKARFHGGSARLDVYYDAFGVEYFAPDESRCDENPDQPAVFGPTYLPYGGFFAEFTPVGAGYTWTADFDDRDTGETVLSTEPVWLVQGRQPEQRLEAGVLPTGRYAIEFAILDDEGSTVYRSPSCHLTVDSVKPEIVGIEQSGSPLYVGDTVGFDVEATDPDFAGATSKLRVECLAAACDPQTVHLDGQSVASFELELTENETTVSFSASDIANTVWSDTRTLLTSHDQNDFDGDRHQDLVAARKSDGHLLLYRGNGDGTLKAPVSLGAGWGSMDVVMAGDLTADGLPDLLARDTRTGDLYTYPGDGDGGFDARIHVGTGWNAVRIFTSGGDFNGDGKNDVLAVRKSDNKLYLYPGRGDGGFSVATAVGTGWGSIDTVTALDDTDRDGEFDLLVRNGRTGGYHLYYGDGTGAFPRTSAVWDLLPDSTDPSVYSHFTGAGDLDENGYADLVRIESQTGQLEIETLKENGFALKAGRVIASGWGANRLPVADTDGAYDYDNDGDTDLIARNGSSDETYLYGGTGTGAFGPRVEWGPLLGDLDLIETAGDLTGDGHDDLLGRVASTGVLYVYPGTGDGGYYHGGRIRVGGGWDAMSAIVSGQDYNGDGKVDLVARESATGNLWLYPGTGTGSHGARVLIGTGWNGMSLITAVGDLDHDGIADVIARKNSDNCLYFYAGKPAGGVKNGVQIGCGWNVMNTIAAVGDFNGDGHVDWVARHTNGSLYLYKGNGAGTYTGSVVIGTGWAGMDQIA